MFLSMGMALVAGPASAQVIERVSIASDGGENDEASVDTSISENGRCVELVSKTDALVPDGIVYEDVYLRDRLLRTIEQVSLAITAMNPGCPQFPTAEDPGCPQFPNSRPGTRS